MSWTYPSPFFRSTPPTNVVLVLQNRRLSNFPTSPKTLPLFLMVSTSLGGPIHNYFTVGNQLWAADVYKEQKRNEQENNFLVGPFGTQVILALAQSGAKNATAQEIQIKLHLPNDNQSIKSTISSCLDLLKSPKHYQIDPAYKIYVKKNLPVRHDFKQIALTDFRAEVENIDFSQKDEAANTINQWVEKQTKNKVHNIISPNQLSPDMGAVLITASHLQGRWDVEFPKEMTKKEDFYKNGSEIVKTSMMHTQGNFQYYSSTELQAKFLEMTFRGGLLSFIVVLPNDKKGLQALEEKSDKVFSKHEFVTEIVNVTLPKFQIESRIDVKRILTQRGTSKLFSDQGDLSGIAGKKGELSVGLIMQKISVNIDEEGTQTNSSAAIAPQRDSSLLKNIPKDFTVDHPFMFYIAANEVVIYAGRVLDPSK